MAVPPEGEVELGQFFSDAALSPPPGLPPPGGGELAVPTPDDCLVSERSAASGIGAMQGYPRAFPPRQIAHRTCHSASPPRGDFSLIPTA